MEDLHRNTLRGRDKPLAPALIHLRYYREIIPPLAADDRLAIRQVLDDHCADGG